MPERSDSSLCPSIRPSKEDDRNLHGSQDPIVPNKPEKTSGLNDSEWESLGNEHNGSVDNGEQQEVFGTEEDADVHYRTMAWGYTISLGVLSLPSAVATIGLVPGLLLIFILGLVATYTGYVIGQFKYAHPHLHTFADAMRLVGGPVLGVIAAIGQVLILVFIMGAHLSGFSIMMNVLTDHAFCSVGFGALGLLICFLLDLPRTFKNVSYLSISSCISIVAAVLVAIVGIGIQKPDEGNIQAVSKGIDLPTGMLPALNIILSYAGHVGFFSFISEMRNPRDFSKALAVSIGFSTLFYMFVGVIIYYYAGPNIASPALGSASPVVRKIAFGLAAPTIVIAGVINGHVAAKYVWVQFWRWKKQERTMGQNSVRSWGSWIVINAVLWVASWLIAEAIPSFYLLLGLISALFCGWFSFGLSGWFWLHLNRTRLTENWKKVALAVLNISILALGLAISGLGLYASGLKLHQGAGGEPFTCKNTYQPNKPAQGLSE
ncbi:amino acid transporter [Patellaria atrata CBS 101060]|uniref:Amino acid transporter n=1 Tax=Patellaria atrata CBS 101060 TaxID=1346257 RepID=A0A9P4SDQ0_9PEZI|nr:amino acid transporter [Patellaria atrata CBS 101060]